MRTRQAKLLRRAFLVGALTDLVALLPMLVPGVASRVWGFDDTTGAYRFAMGYGASLMLGWTVLLAWACQSPMERQYVAVLTVVVVLGLVVTEVVAAIAGDVDAWRLVPTWCLQAVLLALFADAYHYPGVRRTFAPG